MSSTVLAISKNVRFAIRDTRPGNYAISGDEMYRKIIAKSVEMSGEVLGGIAWSTGVCTTAAGNATSTISAVPNTVIEIKNATSGTLLDRDSEALIESLKEGTAPGRARPERYYLTETAAGVTTINWYPVPDAAYVMDALLSAMPTETVADGTVVPFDPFMVRAIEKAVQIECLLSYDDQQAEERRINKAVASEWRRDVASLIRKSRGREGLRMRASHVSPAVY